MSRGAARFVLFAEATWGLALVFAPRRVIRSVQTSEADTSEVVVARTLGARHVAQAAVLLRRPTEGWMLAGAGVNGLHSVSLLLLGAADRRRRHLAECGAATAGIWCATELLLTS